jgi:hypothetical protein
MYIVYINNYLSILQYWFYGINIRIFLMFLIYELVLFVFALGLLAATQTLFKRNKKLAYYLKHSVMQYGHKLRVY